MGEQEGFVLGNANIERPRSVALHHPFHQPVPEVVGTDSGGDSGRQFPLVEQPQDDVGGADLCGEPNAFHNGRVWEVISHSRYPQGM